MPFSFDDITSHEFLKSRSYIHAVGSITGSFISGSFIGDGTEIEGVLFDNIADKPTLVSSSIQIDHDQTTNFEADEHFLQEDITTVGTVTTGNVDAILPSNTVSSSIQIDHDQTTNFEADEHFLQEDITTVGTVTTGNVDAILPSNLISSSLQFNNLTSPFTGSFTGSFVGDGTNLTGVQADSIAFENITDKPTLVSSSLQFNNLTSPFTGSFTGSFVGDGAGLTGLEADSIAFENITDKPTLISSSLQFNDLTSPFTGSFTGSFVGDGTGLTGVAADSVAFENITDKPTLISSSLQFNDLDSPFTGSFTGSFTGDGTNLTGVGSVTSIETTEPLTGGTITETGTIGITQATTSTDGYLSSTDWNTFNDKTICTGTVTSVTSGDTDTITIGGTLTDPTVAANTAAILDGGTNLATGDQIYDHVTTRISGLTDCTGTVTGTGTSNQIATWNTTSELDGSSNLTFDGTTLDVSGITKTDSILVNATAPIANSIITLKKANTSTGTDVGLFYDITKENTTDSSSESYGVVNRVDSTTDFNNRGIITQNNIGRVTGAGNFNYIYPSYNQASIKGAGTVNFAIGGVNEASLNNASGTVTNLWGTHTEIQLTAGTAGEISLLNFDFDQSAGTTITGDFQYINISNDQPVLNISGTARALNIESNLPSFFSGSIGIGEANPSYKLDVSGSGRFTDTLTIQGDTTINGDLFVGEDNNSFQGVSVNGVEVISVTSDGIQPTSIEMGEVNTFNIPVHLMQNDSTRITLHTNTNIGINQTNPSYSLDVTGTGRFTGHLTADADLTVMNNLDVEGTVSGSVLTIGSSHTNTGTLSTIAGGSTNTTTGNCSTIGGGRSNCISGTYATIGGGCNNTVENLNDSILGGRDNSILGGVCAVCNLGASSIVGGRQNKIENTAGWNFIAGGLGNKISGSINAEVNYSNVILGWNNTIDAQSSNSINGGRCNTVLGSTNCSTISGGSSNTITSARNSFIGGGVNNGITSTCESTLVGGCLNSISGLGNNTFLGGGSCNTITVQYNSGHVLVGGTCNISSNAGSAQGHTTVVGGCSNRATGGFSSIVGGRLNSGSGAYSFVGGGCSNNVSNTNSGILGGSGNTVSHQNSFAIGSNLTSTAECTTFMNNSVISGSLTVGQTSALSSTVGRIDATNDIVAFSSSDKRWKTNIININDPIEKINKINGVSFDWIEDNPVHGNKGHDIGVIAQEVEAILPQIVNTRSSGMKAVRYEKLIPLLIEGIKDLQKQINDLKKIN